MTRDEYGDPITAADVLGRDEMGDLNEPGRSYRPAPTRILPAVDADGYDADGFAHGARYGGAS